MSELKSRIENEKMNQKKKSKIQYNKINRIGRMTFSSVRASFLLEILLSNMKTVALTFITSFVLALNVGLLSTDFAKKCRMQHF